MKNTIVVNLIGSPGTGKSTSMASIFAKLKGRGVDAEMTTEFAKDLVWEERGETFKNELYIFAKQQHRLFRVNGKVDVIVTDRPLILTKFYNDKYAKDRFPLLSELALSEHDFYNNINIMLERDKPYNPNGRNQTEEESNEFAIEIEKMLVDNLIDFKKYKANEDSIEKIADLIEEKIKNNNHH